MELKLGKVIGAEFYYWSLNRTFYGIETHEASDTLRQPGVLIVPFMELKPVHSFLICLSPSGLNRTFYGIETGNHRIPAPV